MNKLKRIILALCMMLGLLPGTVLAASTFPNIDDYAECAETVEYVKELDIMVGNEQGNFNPIKTVTCAEMAIRSL